MTAYMGSTGTAPLIPTLGASWWWVVNITIQLLYPWRRSPVPIDWAAGWAPELICSFRRTGLCWDSNHGPSSP